MLKKLFLNGAIAIVLLIFAVANCFAAGTETTDTGLKITHFEGDGLRGKVVERWSNYLLGTSGTYIYNDSGSTTATAGSIKVESYEYKTAGINITNTPADTVTIRPEYQIGTTSFWILGSVTTFVGTQAARLIESNPATNMRWGAIKNGTNSASITFFEVYSRHLRQ